MPSPDKSLEEWLVKLELPEVQTMLELNGWDHVGFIRGVISTEDLTTLGINNEKVKRSVKYPPHDKEYHINYYFIS
jgi:hypothetical protein